MNKNKFLILLFTLAMMFLLVTACGDKEDEPETTPTPAPTAAAETTPTPTPAPEVDDPIEEEPEDPGIVQAPFPAGVLYSLAEDAHFQAAELGTRGGADAIFGDPVYILNAGNPTITVIEADGKKAIELTQRGTDYDSVDVVTSSYDWDLDNNEYVLTVRGSIASAGAIVLGGGGGSYAELASVELNGGDDFEISLILNAEIIAQAGSQGNIRIKTDEAEIDYTITDITVTLYIPRADNVVYSMSTDPYVQALEVGASGRDIVLASPCLMNAGEPDYVIIAGPNGNGINVRNRTNDYFSVDFVTSAINWDFSNTYTLTVIGNIGAGEDFVIGGADAPYDRFAQVEPDGDGNFTASITIASEDDLTAAGNRSQFRMMETGGTEHYEIYDIILTVQ